MDLLVRVAARLRRFLLFHPTSIRKARPETEWLNDNQWTCRRHYPSMTLPAEAQKCWFKGCPSTRPDRSEPVHGKAPTPPTPPEAARRRGATKLVLCSGCGEVMWRRPREVKESRTGIFYCGRECRNGK